MYVKLKEYLNHVSLLIRTAQSLKSYGTRTNAAKFWIFGLSSVLLVVKLCMEMQPKEEKDGLANSAKGGTEKEISLN